MQKRLAENEKKNIVDLYSKGGSVSDLCSEYNIARSTIYLWLNQYQKLKSSNESEVSYKDYYNLKRHTDKLEKILKVIKATGCGLSSPLKEKLVALEKLYGKYSVHVLCDALDVPRGTFYNHIFRKKDVTVYYKRREKLKEEIKIIFDDSKQRFGANKVCAILVENGHKTSPKYVAELMREMNLYSVNTDSKKLYKKNSKVKKQNILKQQFNTTKPNLVWVSDITYFKIKEQCYYICIIIDLFSRKVVSYGISKKNSTYLVTSTFKKAFKARNHPSELTFHSDRGSQYTSNSFTRLISLNKVVQSFSNTGKPHDNAVAESFFAYFKKEEIYRTNYKSEAEFRKSIDEYINFYNTRRPHSTLANKTPERFELVHINSNSKK